MRFYLGTSNPAWLLRASVPLFLSHRHLRNRKSYPRSIVPWALDSGAFSELSMYGEYRTQCNEYVEAVARYQEKVGLLEWAAPMDWMCEPFMVEKTGLCVREHQERTVANYLELRGRGPFVPVIQGWTIDDYVACVGLYADAGVDLYAEPRVGIGSVCRRQSEDEIGRIVMELQPLRLHGFGVKSGGVRKYGHLLESSDSMAWSYRARRSTRMYGCEHRGRCTGCMRFALKWRRNLMATIDAPSLFDFAA